MKVKFVTYGYGKHGPKLYRILRYKDEHRRWVVEVCPCDINGNAVSDPVVWNDGLTWWSAMVLFWDWYNEFDCFVNYRR
jgi:hypothetical protein